MYSHPKAQPKYYAGDIVEHRCLPGVDLVILPGGPHKSLDGDRKWYVRTPDGKVAPVLEKNLIR